MPADDPRVRLVADQLDRLEQTCIEDRVKLADLTIGANTLLAERAVREPVLDTLLGVTLASGGFSGEDECESLFVAYAMIRIS